MLSDLFLSNLQLNQDLMIMHFLECRNVFNCCTDMKDVKTILAYYNFSCVYSLAYLRYANISTTDMELGNVNISTYQRVVSVMMRIITNPSKQVSLYLYPVSDSPRFITRSFLQQYHDMLKRSRTTDSF
jgi:hypothetical protein